MSESSAPVVKGKLNLVVNVAILVTLVAVLSQGWLGRWIMGTYDDWQTGRTIVEVWPDLVEGPSRLAGDTVQPSRTIVEFIDYECSFCRRGAAEVLNAVGREETDVVIRHLPLGRIHASARSAAVAAICSERQGLFAEAHAKLLMEDGWLEDADWEAWAVSLGIRDTEAFARCLQEPDTSRRIEEDMRLADRLGVTGTPAFVVFDRVFPGDFEGAMESLPEPSAGDIVEQE